MAKDHTATRDAVRKAAAQIVRESGLINLTRRALCKRAEIHEGSFTSAMGQTFTEYLGELADATMPQPLKPVLRVRVDPALRKDHILAAALDVATLSGYGNLERGAVAERAGVSKGLINHYFGTMAQLKSAVMRAAVKQEVAEVVAQGLSVRDKHALRAPPALKDKAAAIIAGA